MDGCTNGRIDRWMDGHTYRQRDGYLLIYVFKVQSLHSSLTCQDIIWEQWPAPLCKRTAHQCIPEFLKSWKSNRYMNFRETYVQGLYFGETHLICISLYSATAIAVSIKVQSGFNCAREHNFLSIISLSIFWGPLSLEFIFCFVHIH